MERFILKKLLRWKESDYRQPLILEGVRNVGKTWILKEFGRLYYENTVYFNFRANPQLEDFFKGSRDPARILPNLMLASAQKINPEKTFIIFDEIETAPNVISSLKYFCEEAPNYHVACASHLFRIPPSVPTFFPVGKVNLLEIHPLTFKEFLLANGDANLVDYLDSINEIEAIPEVFFSPLTEKLKMYFITGGMPKPVSLWTKEHDIKASQDALNRIIASCERDFASRARNRLAKKIFEIWESIPKQVDRENKKFLFSLIKPRARFREYFEALEWLVGTQLLYNANRCIEPKLPIVAYSEIDAFKIYLADIGLLRSVLRIPLAAFSEGNRLFTAFNGALTENYVFQSLMTQFDAAPHYWSQNNPPYEVTFLLQRENDIIPVDVSPEAKKISSSMKKFSKLFPKVSALRVRFSLENLKLDGNVLNIPLFMADDANRLIGLALKKIQSSNA